MACPCNTDDSGTRPRRREAVRGRDDGAGVELECSLARVFDLLHAGEYWRCAWAHRRLACAKAVGVGNRKRVPCGRSQRLPEVLDYAILLSRAWTLWRTESSKRLHRPQQHVCCAGQL